MRPSSLPFSRGFTLIELIVVVIIIAIAAAAIVPRVTGKSTRAAEATAMAVGELLSAAGTREALTSKPLAVSFDGSTLRLQTPRTAGRDTLDWGAVFEWADDALIAPVTLDEVELIAASEDAAALDPERWRIEFRPGIARPGVRVVVGAREGSKVWRADLPRGSMRAIVTAGTRAETPPPLEPMSVDLDATGKGNEAW